VLNFIQLLYGTARLLLVSFFSVKNSLNQNEDHIFCCFYPTEKEKKNRVLQMLHTAL